MVFRKLSDSATLAKTDERRGMPLTIFYNIISGNRSHVKIIGSCDGNFMAGFGRLAGRGRRLNRRHASVPPAEHVKKAKMGKPSAKPSKMAIVSAVQYQQQNSWSKENEACQDMGRTFISAGTADTRDAM